MSTPQPGEDLEERSEGPRIPRPYSLGRQELSVCNFPFTWPRGGAYAGGGRTGAGQPQPAGPTGREKGDVLRARALRTDPEVDGNQGWQPYLRV